jgi:hypothetical protein
MQATTHVVNLDDMQGSFFVLGLGEAEYYIHELFMAAVL